MLFTQLCLLNLDSHVALKAGMRQKRRKALARAGSALSFFFWGLRERPCAQPHTSRLYEATK